MQTVLKIHPDDNVVIAITDLEKGSTISYNDGSITLLEPVKKGHKIAVTSVESNQPVIKYGQPIGHATTNIPQGSWIHTHNMSTSLGEILDYTYTPKTYSMPEPSQDTFDGFVRTDGKVGIRNEIWILPTVGCVNSIATSLQKEFSALDIDGIDGIYAYPHPYGCSQLGEDHENTKKILAGLAKHPNACGVLILGLGCENNRIDEFKELLGDYDSNRIKFLECQAVNDEHHHAKAYIQELIEYGQQFKREPVDMSNLIVGLKCGGSDGYSGITANPMLGRFTEVLTSKGGSTILTEVPEMFGAETLLMERCVTEDLFNQTVSMVNRFKDYFKSSGQPIYENPSPGNKDGGISTLEDKSLGCIQKGGKAPIQGVLDYGEQLQNQGLNLLYGPGNDLVSTTAMTATGAQIILFTTGRGTPFGCPAPTVKIATNTELYNRKSNWMDFNCGTIVDGESIEDNADAFYQYLKEVISGKQLTKAEINECREIAIFKNGITL